ncbi:MAG: dihydrofolate reductase [Chthoniobacterales bacterium]
MKAIVAMSKNRVIGAVGGIPWHLPEDFRFFKKTTLGHPIVMGRKTYQSLGKTLPGRKHLVLTRQYLEVPEEVSVIHSIEELFQLKIPSEEIFVIGGAEIYRLLLPACDTLFVTHVHRSVEGDTFFPPFEEEFEPRVLLMQTEDFTIREYGRKIRS